MSNSEIMQKLMDEISNDHAWYLGYIGALVALVIAFVGLIGYLQMRLSDKQINKLKDDIKEDIHKEYPVDEFKKIQNMEQAFTRVSESQLLQFQQTLLDTDRQDLVMIYKTTQNFIESLMIIEAVSLPENDLKMLFMDLKQLVSYAASVKESDDAREKHSAMMLNGLFIRIHENFKNSYSDKGYNKDNGLYQLIEERIEVFQEKQSIKE